jgi:hypothetical protein
MRRALAPAAALALLAAACGVSVEGAPCSTDASCPADQVCGADLRCSTAAPLCTHCRPGDTACRDGGLATCAAAANGICADFGEPALPGPHQVCEDVSPGTAHLACAPSSCTAAGSFCTASDAYEACEIDAASGCAFAAAVTTCAPGKTCAEPQPGRAQCHGSAL